MTESDVEKLEALYFDGKSAIPVSVILSLLGDAILVSAAARTWRIPRAQMRFDSHGENYLRIDISGDAGEVITLEKDGDIRTLLDHFRDSPDSLGLTRFDLYRYSLLLITACVAVIVLARSAEEVIGKWIPDALSRKLIAPFSDDFRKGSCNSEPILDSIRTYSSWLISTEMRIEPVVSSSGLVNAFALPGMMVVNFGLIEESGSPDELIGVMAHEAGHLEHAHFGRGIAGRMLLSGLSTSLGVFSGLLPAAVNNQFTSELETDADAVAIQKLDALGISRKPMVDFFVRQKAKHSDNQVSIAAETLLSTHPLTESRILHFLKDPPSAGIISPAIRERLERDRLHWKEIKTHCLNFETLKEGQ